MKFSRLFLNRLQDLPEAHDTVVVIDTLRSFTTAAVALDRGAHVIYPVDGVLAAQGLAARLAGAVSVGAIAGGAWGVVAAIGGLAGGIVGNLVGRSLDDRERARMQAAAQQAAAENRRVNWSEPGKANGYVLPVGQQYVSGGRTCRQFEQVATKEGRTEREMVSMCRNSDGSWTLA